MASVGMQPAQPTCLASCLLTETHFFLLRIGRLIIVFASQVEWNYEFGPAESRYSLFSSEFDTRPNLSPIVYLPSPWVERQKLFQSGSIYRRFIFLGINFPMEKQSREAIFLIRSVPLLLFAPLRDGQKQSDSNTDRFFPGKRVTSQRFVRDLRPLRTCHLAAWQKTPPRDQDQTTDPQPKMERNFLLWR